MRAFYLPDGPDRYVSTELTRGPWDNTHQHGGPPAALLVGAMARHGDPAYQVVRVGIELLRPVPLAPLRVEVGVERDGRTAQRLWSALYADDKQVLAARALRLRRSPVELPPHDEPPWPDREDSEPFEFPFFQHDVGYHKTVELRLAHGRWGATPVGFWARNRVPLVEGRDTTPLEALMVLADAQSGMGVPLDPLKYSFVNPDLTLYVERMPVGEWFGLDIRSTANADGFGLAQSALRDERGLVGRSAQSLVVRAR